MSKETLIREIQDTLSTDIMIFHRVSLLLNEYQEFAASGSDQELSVLARMQTELEQLLNHEDRLISPHQTTKIQTVLDKVLQQKHSLLTPIEKNIHFVWIGAIGSAQIAYMKAWACYNPDYEIQLWHDPNALLADVLRKKIKLYAGTLLGIGNNMGPDSTASTNIRAIIDLQNEFYKDYFLPGIGHKQTFDDCATRFLLAKGWNTLEELNQIKSAHAHSFNTAITELQTAQRTGTKAQSKKPIRLCEINATLFQNATGKDYYQYYLKELGLRQNLASASDKARYMILYKKGGVYLDADLLPHPHSAVWQKIEIELLSNLNKRKIINAAYLQSDSSYMTGVFWMHLVDVLRSIFTGRSIAFDTNVCRRRAYVEIVLMNSLLRACNGDGQPPKPDYHQLAHDISQGNLDPFFDAVQPLFAEIDQIIATLPKEILMDPLGELRMLQDGLGYMEHPYVEGRITNSYLFAPKDSSAMLQMLDLVFQRDVKIAENHLDRLDVSNPPTPTRRHSTLDVNLMMYRYDGWIAGSVATVYSSGPKIITDWLANYVASHPRLAAHFEVFKQQFFIFSNISRDTEEDMKSTWIGSAMMTRDSYYEKPSSYQSQLVLQFDSDPATEAAARWLYNKRKENSLWVKIILSGGRERIRIHGDIPANFKFYDDGADEKARILLVGRGENRQLSGFNGKEIAKKILRVLSSQEVKSHIDPRFSPSDQSADVISRISVVSSGIEQFGGEVPGTSSGTRFSLNYGFTYQLLTHLRDAHISISSGVSVRDAIIGVDAVGRKWTGNWDALSATILWHASQSAYKWIGVLNPGSQEVKFTKTWLEKDVLTQVRPWIDINKHGRFSLFSRYAFRDGIIPSKMRDTFSEEDFTLFTDKFDKSVGHRILMADVMVLFSGMKKKEWVGGKKVRTAIVDERADQLRILRDVLRQVTFNEHQEQWLAWLASSKLVSDKIHQKLRQLLTDHPRYYAQLRASADEDLFDFYYIDFAKKNAYYPIINHLGAESQSIKVIYLGDMEKRLHALIRKKELDLPAKTLSLGFFEENVLKLISDQTELLYSIHNTGKKAVSTETFQSDISEMATDLLLIRPRKNASPLAESYLASALIFENLTKEIALLGSSVPEGSLALLQKIIPIRGQNKSRVPFLDPRTGQVTHIDTNKRVFRQARDLLAKSYLIPLPDDGLMATSRGGYSIKMAADLSSWIFNKIFVARFLIEQIKAGKGLFAAPDTQSLSDGLGQALVLQHYVGILGMANDLADDLARLSYFTVSKVLNIQAVEFSLRRMAYFSSELLSGTTSTRRYAVLAKGILEKNQIKYALKKVTSGISKSAMGLGLIFSAADVALTTEAFLNAPDSDSQMILGTQLGFSVVGFGIQLGAIAAALAGAASLALALGVLALIIAVTAVLVILLLESFQKEASEVKACALFFKTLKESRQTGYVLKNGCFVHEGPACITKIELATHCKITFGSQKYQTYGSKFPGRFQAKFGKLNILREFNSAGVVLTALPAGSDTEEALSHNLVLPCIAQNSYDFSYTGSASETANYEFDAIFATVRALEQDHKDFVFFHRRMIPGVSQLGFFFHEMKAITTSRIPTNIKVSIAQNQWALHFPWIENREDYKREYNVFKKENPDLQVMEYQYFKEKVTEQEQLFRKEIISNASEITYHIENSSGTQQILVLPPTAFPLKLQLQGDNWLISALALGTIAPLRRERDQLYIGEHQVKATLTADQSLQVQYLIHPKATLIQRITASGMSIGSLTFDASDYPGSSIKTELSLLCQSQAKAYPDFAALPYLLLKNYQEDDYRGNAHYLVKNGMVLCTPVLAPFKSVTKHTHLLTIEAGKAFFYANIDLNATVVAEAKSDMADHSFQPTFWITHNGLSLLEFINYSFLPFFSSSTRLTIKTGIVQEQGQLMLIEHYKKGASSIEVQYVININSTTNQPLLLRKIQLSQNIFNTLTLDALFSGTLSSQVTLEQLRSLLCSILLGDDLSPSDLPRSNTQAAAGNIHTDEIVHITDNENTKEHWWSRSCGILAPITLPTEKREKIKPIWSGKTDYQQASFWMPAENEDQAGMKKLYVKRNTEPYADYTKLGLLKHSGHTPERLYIEDIQGNTYAIDVSGRAYLSIVGSTWLATHKDDLPVAFSTLLTCNDDEADERFHLPVLCIEGFSYTDDDPSADPQPLKAWYDTCLKRFYFHRPINGQKPDYLTNDTHGKAALWDTHNKTLFYVGSMSIDQVQEFDTLIPKAKLPHSEIVMCDVQQAWKNEGLIHIKNNKLLFSVDFKQSPYHFALQGISEEYSSPYLLSYQLAHALKREFFSLFGDSNDTYTYDHYLSWETRLPNTSFGVQRLSAINFTKRKVQLRKILIEKIAQKTPQDESITPGNMWAFLKADLISRLPKAHLRTSDIHTMIREVFTTVQRSSTRNIILEQKRLLQFSQYGWYDTDSHALFIIPLDAQKLAHCQYLAMSRDEKSIYISVDEENLYKLSARQVWQIMDDWPEASLLVETPLFIKRFGDELIFIEKRSPSSGFQKIEPFSADFLSDMLEIKTLHLGRKSETLCINMQDWSKINFVIQAHGRKFDEDIELIVKNDNLEEYKVQREGLDLWISHRRREFALCIAKVFNPDPVPEDITLKTVRPENVITFTLGQLVEEYNRKINKSEKFYDQLVYPTYFLDDLLIDLA